MDNGLSISMRPPTASDCRTLHDFFAYWRNLVAQEQRFREQLADLTATAAARETEAAELRERSRLLQADVDDKTTTMLRLQSELESANKQSELLRQKLRQLEEDIAGFKRCNAQLAAELATKAGDDAETEAARRLELEEQLRQLQEAAAEREGRAQRLTAETARLQAELAAALAERDALVAQRDALDAQRRQLLEERREEMEIVQKALEEAQAEREAAQQRFERDFERLRTVNTDREQHLLDDFEWKLREVQSTCKRRLEEKEQQVEQRVAAARAELADRLEQAERRVADLYDTQRALRNATRDLERVQGQERQLKDEVARLKELVETERKFAASVQRNYDRHVSEADRKLNAKAQELRDELTVQWEEKARGECARLRSELQQIHGEEIALAVRAARHERDADYEARLAALEKRLQNALNEVSALRVRMAEKEAQHARELEAAQTEADRSAVELRRKLDKLDMQYQEQIERMQHQHEEEVEKLTEEAERRVQEVEKTWQMQMSSTRATLELVKEQLERDAQDRLDDLERLHRRRLEEQWEQLTQEREDALESARELHRAQLEQLRADLEAAGKDNTMKEKELAKALAFLRTQLETREESVTKLQSNVELLQGGLQVLNSELNNQTKLMKQNAEEAQRKLREREMQLQEEFQEELAKITAAHVQEKISWQEQLKDQEAQMSSSINDLMNKVEEARRQPRSEDEEHIRRLEAALAAQERETLFFKTELCNREAMYNRAMGVQPVVGVVDPLQHRRRKAGAGAGAGAAGAAGARPETRGAPGVAGRGRGREAAAAAAARRRGPQMDAGARLGAGPEVRSLLPAS